MTEIAAMSFEDAMKELEAVVGKLERHSDTLTIVRHNLS